MHDERDVKADQKILAFPGFNIYLTVTGKYYGADRITGEVKEIHDTLDDLLITYNIKKAE